jgi:hypothetical protein
MISVGYGIFFEWFWGGRTPGKRIMHLRVVDAHGLKLEPSQVVMRNLLRFVDAIPAFYLVGGAAMLLSRDAQRLGDMAANTAVIRERRLAPVDAAMLAMGKYNSLLDYPHLVTRLRQRASPALVGVVGTSDRKPPLAQTRLCKLLILGIFRAFGAAVEDGHLTRSISVRGVKNSATEGKTAELGIEQARKLFHSIDAGKVVGLRDRAVLGVLAYTGARVGAVAKLRLSDYTSKKSRQVTWKPSRSLRHMRLDECPNAAEAAGFDVLVTTDKNLSYQQNLYRPQDCDCRFGLWPDQRQVIDAKLAKFENAPAKDFVCSGC